MLPILLNLSFLKIYTFGVFLVLAFFWGSFLLWKNIRLTVFKEEDVFNSLFIGLAGGLFGGRLVYVALNFDKFGLDILKFMLFNGFPGFSLYGVFFGGFIALYLYLSLQKVKFKEIIDYFISPIFLALAIGKLGSFFSGSIDLRHLTPLYEALLFFLGLFLSYKLLFQIRKDKRLNGFSFYFFWWFIALVYFFCDKIKDYKLFFFGRSFNEFVSLIILLTFTVYFIYYFRANISSTTTGVKNYLKYYGEKTYSRVRKKNRKKV